jgi:asparagine synthase (glutamine-hydrolysing)
MIDLLKHRGPDQYGIWQDHIDIHAPTLIHTRLSILDLSNAGKQPMISESGRYILTYNGEIYNYKDLRLKLEAEHIEFQGHSDTEVLLALIEKYSIDRTLDMIEGMFAFAVWDRQSKVLHLARDHFGEKPLYIFQKEAINGTKNVAFSSDPNGFYALSNFDGAIDEKTLSLYFHYGYIPAPHSIYQNVQAVKAGHVMTIKDGEITRNQAYFKPLSVIMNTKTDEESAPKSIKAHRANVKAVLEQSVQERMSSDVPLGVFLSGGIDSSLVTSIMQAHSTSQIKSFCIGFESEDYNEAHHARAIATHLGTDHHEWIMCEQDAMNIVPELADIYSEPFADLSQIPSILLARFAKQHVTVALTGDGGDEFFGGYNRHTTLPSIWNIGQKAPTIGRKLAQNIIGLKSAEQWNALLKFHPQMGTKLYKVKDALSAQTLNNAYDAVLQSGLSAVSPALSIESDHPTLPDSLTDTEKLMIWDTRFYLPHDVLTKMDRATMSVGLEGRCPLLSPTLFKAAWALPIDQKNNGHMGKIMLRDILGDYIPQDLFNRPKQGFSVPMADWLRGGLKNWAEGLLERFDEKQIRADIVKTVWDEHQSHSADHTQALWTILMFQSWKENLDKKRPGSKARRVDQGGLRQKT